MRPKTQPRAANCLGLPRKSRSQFKDWDFIQLLGILNFKSLDFKKRRATHDCFLKDCGLKDPRYRDVTADM